MRGEHGLSVPRLVDHISLVQPTCIFSEQRVIAGLPKARSDAVVEHQDVAMPYKGHCCAIFTVS